MNQELIYHQKKQQGKMIIAEFLINDFRFWCDVEEGFHIDARTPIDLVLSLAEAFTYQQRLKTQISVIETKQKLFISRVMLENIHLLMRITFIWKPSWFANSFWTLQSCQDAESISNRKYLQRLLKMWSWECSICHYSMTAQLIYFRSC